MRMVIREVEHGYTAKGHAKGFEPSPVGSKGREILIQNTTCQQYMGGTGEN